MNRCNRLERKSVPGWLWQALAEEGEERTAEEKSKENVGFHNHLNAPVGVCVKSYLNYKQGDQGRGKYDGKDRLHWERRGQAIPAFSVPRSLNLSLRVYGSDT